MAYLFEMYSLSASYGANLVLQDVNFKVNENDFIGVIGPNGGGKTTF
jgi:zinc transport system ATP-binding protein